MTWEVREGDCAEAMRAMEPESVDAVVCDPPYGLEFMGKEWDRLSGQPGYVERGRMTPESSGLVQSKGFNRIPNSFQAGRPMQAWHEAWALEALRVLKPGGHLIAFGGTRTYHRLACAVEDAGFEIRDTLAWLYGSGFPKSLDVSKAIDKAAGAERAVVGQRTDGRYAHGFSEEAKKALGGVVAAENETGFSGEMGQITAPATPEAAEWQGWGTALKPAHEPIVLARKPLVGTVAANVLQHGNGGLNVDGCGIAIEDRSDYERNHSGDRGHDGTRSIEERGATDMRMGGGNAAAGRWPANVLLDPEAGELLDEQVGELVSGANPTRRGSDKFRDVYGDFAGQQECEPARGVDRGGPSRFFYCAKTSRGERNAGLDEFATKPLLWSSGEQSPGTFQAEGTERAAKNAHPTVKPIELMRWLCRLVTPPGGLVLDPFVGSGTTGCAAAIEGFRFLGLEREPEYVAIARARIAFWAEHGEQALEKMAAAERARAADTARSEAGQLDLLGGAV